MKQIEIRVLSSNGTTDFRMAFPASEEFNKDIVPIYGEKEVLKEVQKKIVEG